MSSLYNLEPQPTAKVILQTTSGDLLLELFASQTPLTSRNFLQHCLDGYYTNTLFHRLVPGFIIQGGDPTGSGLGGASSYDGGAPFADEFHSRLKFNRRGLLGMANTGKDENGSQFFLTLGKTEELTGRNTMFGRIEGDTIFNLVKMGEAELVDGDGAERPMYPTRVTGAEILVNPFEDMVRRVPQSTGRLAEKGKEKPKVKRKAAKGLLSFGGDGGEEGEDVTPILKPKFNTKAVNGGKENSASKRPATDAVPERPRKRRATLSPSPEPEAVSMKPAKRSKAPSRGPSPSPSPEPEVEVPKQTALERANEQIASLKKSLQRNVVVAPVQNTQKKSALEFMIPSTATRGRRRKPGGGNSSALGGSVSREEQKALDTFNAFRKRLEAAPAAVEKKEAVNDDDESPQNGANADAAQNGDDAGDDDANLCELHFVPNCQSCKRWDEEANREDESGDEADSGWMSHRLTFEKDRLGKSLEWKRQNEKELVVIDPREKEKEFKEERKRRRDEGKAK